MHRREHRFAPTFGTIMSALVGLVAALAIMPAAAPACCVGIHLQPPRHARLFDPPPLAIGDSVLLGAAHEVAARGFEVDAREGRFMRHALRILRHLRQAHRRPPVVVVAIGTNEPPTAIEVHHALALLRRGQTLVFVTPKRSWSGLPDGAVRAAHRSHPRRVKVLDWLSFSAGHDPWFYGDGTHLRPAGARGYAALLARALRWIRPDGCACVGRLGPTGFLGT
jgi:hypothetical protein